MLFKKKRKLYTDFQSLITKRVDMIQVTKDQDAMGRGITLYMSETVSLLILLKHVHKFMCDIGEGKMSVSAIFISAQTLS